LSEPEVLARVEGLAGRITLNRPKALNALNAGMCLAITEALLAWASDPGVAQVVIDGAGDRAFCAGGDIRVVAESGRGDGAEARRFFHAEYRMNELLQRYPKPVIALMDGVTMGGGVGISAPARWRVATERTLWAMPEGDIGLFPDVGGGWHLSRLPGEAGAWLALTGARLKAADCRALGIATHFVPSRELEALMAGLCAGSTLDPFDEDPGPAAVSADAAAINRLFIGSSVEAIVEELGVDGSEWALRQREIIARKCPATLKVALRLIREGRRRTRFAEEMQVEYRVAARMCRRHDFIDGVRALIVDKDNAPRWDPPDLAGVTPALLDGIFAPLPADEEWSPLP
jgi:enoyl-CoA hydratase